MIKLQLLGLQPDGEHLTLNDAGGNRYSLPITDDLRAALRRDVSSTEKVTETVRQMSPREIQALVREGLSVAEICELGALPPGRVSVLAHPIIAEREHMARRAQALVMGREVGSLTLDELVTSRLVARGVNISDITWDTVRKPSAPWTITLEIETTTPLLARRCGIAARVIATTPKKFTSNCCFIKLRSLVCTKNRPVFEMPAQFTKTAGAEAIRAKISSSPWETDSSLDTSSGSTSASSPKSDCTCWARAWSEQ